MHILTENEHRLYRVIMDLLHDQLDYTRTHFLFGVQDDNHNLVNIKETAKREQLRHPELCNMECIFDLSPNLDAAINLKQKVATKKF